MSEVERQLKWIEGLIEGHKDCQDEIDIHKTARELNNIWAHLIIPGETE